MHRNRHLWEQDGEPTEEAPPRTVDEDVVEQVVEAVLSQGVLHKDEILRAWGLAEADYPALQEEVLRDRRMRKGPPGRGGFRRAPDRPVAQDEAGRDDGDRDGGGRTGGGVLLEGWEAAAVRRLAEVLRHRDLEKLLGPLAYTLREARRQESGRDRRGTSLELAEALVLQHGQDLFADVQVRDAVAGALGADAPGRWHPGKSGAQAFVRDTGFPPELAGIPSPDRPPSHEYLEGRVELAPLADFQLEIQREMLVRLQAGGEGRGIVTLPTGAGKTRVAVESIQYWLTDRWDPHEGRARRGVVLWLAHTEELCEQAYACFRQVWESRERTCPLLLVRFWGRYNADPATVRETVLEAEAYPCVLISTPHRVVSLLSRAAAAHAVGDGEGEGPAAAAPTDADVLDEALALLRASLGLVVIDEAHRAAARSYRRILRNLVAPGLAGSGDGGVALVGLTATPFRMEYVDEHPEDGTLELREIFRSLIEPRRTLGAEPRRTLQERRVLAVPEFETIGTATRIRSSSLFPAADGPLDEESIERIDHALALRTDNTPRRLLVFERLREIAADPASSILYFGPTVRDAECMAFLLRRDGVPTGVVSGTTRDVLRRRMVADFKKGRLRVLCNCEVLTTGFDAPRVTHVVMARPTVSRVLYEQIVGRGLRGTLFGGTDRCVILDFEDNFRGRRPELGYEAFRRIWEAS